MFHKLYHFCVDNKRVGDNDLIGGLFRFHCSICCNVKFKFVGLMKKKKKEENNENKQKQRKKKE